ncbi:hypothetical protein Hanom_Chr02g00095881 [Helianthus anomalus]
MAKVNKPQGRKWQLTVNIVVFSMVFKTITRIKRQNGPIKMITGIHTNYKT